MALGLLILSLLTSASMTSAAGPPRKFQTTAIYVAPSQMAAMMEVKAALTRYINLTSWAASNPCASWALVTCWADGLVRRMNLSAHAIQGTLPSALGTLSTLDELVATNNWLTAPLPDSFSRLTALTNLQLSENYFAGPIPDSWGNMKSLVQLYLNLNYFSGGLPDTFSQLTNMQKLFVSMNLLNSSFPTVVCAMTNLRELRLSYNKFTGSVPSCLSTLSFLYDLHMDSNDLTGTLPAAIGDLPALQNLFMNQNSLSGPLPPIITKLTNLRILVMSSNPYLDGPLPSDLGNMVSLTDFLMEFAAINGTIPDSISSLTRLSRIFFGGNKLSGSIPDALSSLTGLVQLYLSENQLNGSIPATLSSLTGLKGLSLRSNQLSNSIPAAISSLTALTTLRLDSNQLNGSIPDGLSALTALKSLYLNTNQLDGSIPTTLSSLTGLTRLFLAFNKFNESISFVLNLTSLQSLTINNNHFSGSVPSSKSGSCLLNLTLDASNNYLSGPISGLGKANMDFSNNFLTGPLKTSTTADSRLAGNCFAQPKCPRAKPNCSLVQQRPTAECTAFCGGFNACDGRGICYPDGPSLVPTCLCQPGYVFVGRFYCFAQGWDVNLSISKPILPTFTLLTKGTQQQTAGQFMAEAVKLFAFPTRLSTGCGVELAFSVNFTFCLLPLGGSASGGSNGFAFVITSKAKVGKADGVGYDGMAAQSVAIEFDTLQNAKYNDKKEQHVGINTNGSETSLVAVESGFTLTSGDYYTAWVDYDPWNRGSMKVYLADSKVKPDEPLLEREVSLCAVLQPSGVQAAFFFGFVASTTVKPFLMDVIRSSSVHTEIPTPPEPEQSQSLGLVVSEDTYVPASASPFSRYVSTDYQWTGSRVSADSWAIRDLHNWDAITFLDWPVKDQLDCSACWAYALVASVEAAYGIALNREAPQLSVESLFAAMGITGTDKCTAGGSPTAAFETLVTLDDSSGLTAANDTAKTFPVQAFERTLFKGYFGLMLAVRRQPVVVHIEASADTFFQYNGAFKYQDPACYTGSLNHVVLVVGYLINRDDGSQKRISPPSWIIRNSWGVGWGDSGHMYMDIQGGYGVCGINVLPGIYPIVKISEDPCRNNSYKGDQDSNGMNPCGRFPCQKTTEGNRCTCVIGNVTQALQPFVEVANGDGSKTCAYVDVCGSYFKNPCYVGACINDLSGSYSCICPPNHVERVTLYGFPTCDPANSSATDMTVTGDNWQCSDVSALVGIPLDTFRSTNAGINCSQALARGSVVQLDGAPDIPCTAFFYTLKSDTCSSISAQLSLGAGELAKLNPGLNCSSTGLKAGQSVCIERSSAVAYTVPECLRYGTLTAQTTCEGLIQKYIKETGVNVTGADWANLYRNNPGLTCSSTIPTNIQVQVCLRADYWSFTASVVCKKGKSKKVDKSDSCSTIFATCKFKNNADFYEYNGKNCSGDIGNSKSICVPHPPR
ncbi:unnamed protein product [Closterium sp. Yama58-4]|nr:unnamed protein product [Closterium sp. Yama58-4]